MEKAWIFGLIGGLGIGLAAAALLLFNGRIAGMSGMLADAFSRPTAASGRESAVFLLGALLGPMLLTLGFDTIVVTIEAPLVLLLASGVVVGFGVSLANGCTSGHGVCGLSRLSLRSMAATATFMGSTAVTVFVVRHVLGAGA